MSSTICIKQEVLSLDLEESHYLYRIRRNSRVVYVSILDGDIIPRDCRTDDDRWGEEWKTLTVRSGFQGIESTPDEFIPHRLDLQRLNVPGAVFLNLLDLTRVSRISDRISRVKYDGKTWILKVARFRHEIPALQQEETKARTVGFLVEEILGKIPDIHNLRHCVETVRLLHTCGIVHGDLNKYNFLMTEHGAKNFDFEASAARPDVDPAAAEEELKSFPGKLAGEPGIGKRWATGLSTY
ncbi:uncharacterized protein P174DRAFT_462885 [Aspergillus novofumigatus IBT 16806]|uniref:non-specific serine/threonine protein kinase n=1 Tax=Aspergillus novofumigatus (strain IBT 16806) TaxID=1392255 RepID=A0A2I1BZA9_ASPN1|nr:uncharacterized protein P174DRAFT_462885 [Aspergillus novofumigatus IBT 16806]PKX90707.1 hypothetical protein P174DRAFT_462885 [Aspergillus novofumigatus IBT 16806]